MNIAAQAARNLGGFVPNKIFIGGVPITCTEEQLRSYFETFGRIAKVELHTLRGFGYITYESVESVDGCLEKYEEHYLCKKWVEVKRSIPRELIDAYEREQRRLHTEVAAVENGEKPIETQAKGEPSLPAPANPSPSAWGGGGPATQRRSGPTPNARGAPGPGVGMLSRVAQLREMGFSDAVAKKVLSECAWDVNAAIDRLLTSGVAMEEEEDEVEEPAPPPAAPTITEAATPVANIKIDEAHAESPGEAAEANAGEERVQANGTPVANGPSPSHAAEVRTPSPAPVSPPLPASPKKQPSREASPSPEPMTAADAAELKAAAQEVVATSTPQPRKRIERVSQFWAASESSQMSVREKEFVQVWSSTETANGWVYGESCDEPGRVGWLPVWVLQKLPDGQRWMRAIQDWTGAEDPMVSVKGDSMVIVWTMTRTPEGWSYVEVESENGEFKGGWLPVFCLTWADDQ